MAKLPDCYPFHLHLSTAGDSKNRLRPQVKFQPVRLVNFRPAPTVLDLYSRKIVGWAMAPNMPAELVCTALQIAIAQRRPSPGLIVHSDRGSPPVTSIGIY